ncbi:MAG: hypothetical protein NZ570_07690 [Candidatus Caldarchaeum sp.]|nr:hypothetical protein [Candidatus Caldarchaeum sp.]MDW8359708.1 hypothetical protein [Candidatus Caldarchaeum sp.]
MRLLSLSALMFVVAALLSSSAVEFPEGSYFVYSYTLSAQNGREVSGTVSSRVVDALADGQLRLRVEASFNDGVATLEKNLPSKAFKPFILPLEGMVGRYSVSREGYSLVLSVERLGESVRTVGGKTYETARYRVFAESERGGERVSVNADAEVVKGSEVVYSLSATFVGDGEARGSLNLQLADSNIDLTEFTHHRGGDARAELTSMLLSLGVSEGVSTPSSLMRQLAIEQFTERPASPSSDWPVSERMALVGVAGLSALAATSLFILRTRKPPTASVGRKPHYV